MVFSVSEEVTVKEGGTPDDRHRLFQRNGRVPLV